MLLSLETIAQSCEKRVYSSRSGDKVPVVREPGLAVRLASYHMMGRGTRAAEIICSAALVYTASVRLPVPSYVGGRPTAVYQVAIMNTSNLKLDGKNRQVTPRQQQQVFDQHAR